MRIRRPLERWFTIPDEDPEKTEIKIKHLSPGELQDIMDSVIEQEIRYEPADESGKIKPIVLQKNDTKRDRELTLLKRVVDWKNIYDEDGNPLECTPENIIRASREIEGFASFVNKKAEILAKDIKKEAEEQEKN